MHGAGEEPGPQPQAWTLPFSQPGHRAALQAWPRVQAEMPALPMELLVQWSQQQRLWVQGDRKSTRLNSSHLVISYAVFCLKKKNLAIRPQTVRHALGATRVRR